MYPVCPIFPQQQNNNKAATFLSNHVAMFGMEINTDLYMIAHNTSDRHSVTRCFGDEFIR